MCMGGDAQEDTAERLRSREIERILKQDEKKMAREVKLLLLGAGESGKSTILKQMRLIYAAGFSKADREQYRGIIFTNITESMRLILEAMEIYSIPFEKAENEQYVGLIMPQRELSRGEDLPREYIQPLKMLWRDAGVQSAVARGNEFALHDNLSYYFEALDRVFASDFVPNDQDILRSRLKTTGITEAEFNLGQLVYRMFDVGGQRSERKKWIHCFENVTALLFLVAISGYDQCLVEDKDANQMQEALMLFESICNSQWFVRTSIILFMNKIDLFREKINSGTAPVKKYFPEYTGNPDSFKEASEFFHDNFNRLNRSSAKEIYFHYTNATDTDLLKITMSSVQDIILQTNLEILIL
ncbi:guanine nucleotide-binding protein alpha-2 subunit [Drechslerella stenobrocha 248]|uniref:Guanine nucleotide-binding protein alpha-2 subunit n=1 Tax=Drechslerella stenobrocha 248 TaxID=1043628 RepID=W7HL00_9PEZI|nr:guanine nucleotide-binding protein alpha-2 subunit [Drechslerella stenobrocha 248]